MVLPLYLFNITAVFVMFPMLKCRIQCILNYGVATRATIVYLCFSTFCNIANNNDNILKQLASQHLDGIRQYLPQLREKLFKFSNIYVQIGIQVKWIHHSYTICALNKCYTDTAGDQAQASSTFIFYLLISLLTCSLILSY